MNKYVKGDLYRLCCRTSKSKFLKYFFFNRNFRNLYYHRKYNLSTNCIIKFLYRLLHKISYKKSDIELPLSAKIGEGFLAIHPYSITINSNSIIGSNFTILKGATVGATKDEDGNSKTPIIGDNVYIGINSTIVGNIKIGNNVLISPNSFVNFDVPDDSIVIGNPAIIHHKKDASIKYIKNLYK